MKQTHARCQRARGLRGLAHSKACWTRPRLWLSRSVLTATLLPGFSPGSVMRILQAKVNPKQALMRWTNARRRAVPTLPRRRYSRSFSTRYIRSQFTNVSKSRPSASLNTISFSRASRVARWLEPINTLTSGARATRSGWLTTTAGCGPASAKSQVQISHCFIRPRLQGGSPGGAALGAIVLLGVEVAQRARRIRNRREGLFLGIQNAQPRAHHFAGVVVAPARNQARYQFLEMLC